MYVLFSTGVYKHIAAAAVVIVVVLAAAAAITVVIEVILKSYSGSRVI